MQGDPEVIEFLNEQLTAELTAINQYFLHAKMQENFGWTKLAQYTRRESFDEMKHAEVLTDRILFLDGLPNYQRLFHVRVGQTVTEMFQADRQIEVEAIDRLRRGVEVMRAKGTSRPRTSSSRSSRTRSTTSTTWTPSWSWWKSSAKRSTSPR
ncbi:hypothetical protein SAV14893_057030 [Streptomyces avermitilis]|uniref:Bacterioferritin n=1 Tax=Streptomyces avermitilis TaxID=33903 RepID=A0A4D4M387_STRAX|nr:hypothetical protein SAV14893_057030 [Streptomyces avermitilis]